MATVIPQRELRNNAGDVLRRAEAGEVFTVTVDGRPVAQLAPLPENAWPTAEEAMAAMRALPRNQRLIDDLHRMREEDRANSRDPWT